MGLRRDFRRKFTSEASRCRDQHAPRIEGVWQRQISIPHNLAGFFLRAWLRASCNFCKLFILIEFILVESIDSSFVVLSRGAEHTLTNSGRAGLQHRAVGS